MSKILRMIPKQLASEPFGKNDKECIEANQQIYSLGQQAIPLRDEIEKLKKRLAPIEKQIESAEGILERGKPVDVQVKEIIDHEANVVHSWRMDTSEALEDRVITDEDRQPMVGDQEI
jgi:hypothetical protein